MIHELVDMDTQKIRYVSESSNASTSGYSTMSPGPSNYGGGMQRTGNLSPASSILSMPSPSQSPGTAALQTEFSHLNFSQIHQHQNNQNTYTALANPTIINLANNGNVVMQQQQYLPPQHHQQYFNMNSSNISGFPASTLSSHNNVRVKNEYKAQLRILEQPVEKFRFRYKSEMHGTHGSLNGANSKRTPKTYPEVELQNFNGRAIIRCSLFQTNLESPHSHQLVVRKDDTDICDPHELEVSPDSGFIAQFQNMGIIHTAKKFIFEELLKKKMNRLLFETGRSELSTKQVQELHKETEKEAKDMNLNQVRLCFEAFKREDNNTYTRVAAPVYTNPINNRKSAQTGELRIVRLSIASGSVKGGDDLILLVEKVSKKNIKVRFYELNDDEETIWEAFGNFRESDVHHQYAIVCRTPPYKDKSIEKPVEINIELVRPSDDERSFPPVLFRYKPDAVASRKRRRTCSTATSSSNSGTSINSFELPKTVQDQQHMNAPMNTTTATVHNTHDVGGITISAEYGKDDLLASAEFNKMINCDSEELHKLYPPELMFDFPDSTYKRFETESCIEADGAPSSSSLVDLKRKEIINKMLSSTTATSTNSNGKQNIPLQRIFKIFDEARNSKEMSKSQLEEYAKKVTNIYVEHAEANDGDSIMHEIIMNDNPKVAFKICHVLNFFKVNNLLNHVLNSNNESALHSACLNDRTLYIRPLLGLGCDPNLQDNRGNTALHVAVREQHSKCIDSFINMKSLRINLAIRNDEGLTPLHLAIRLKFDDIAKKLLTYDPSAVLVPNSIDGNNALHMAVHQQNLDLIEAILNGKTDKSALLLSQNTAGQRPLQLAKVFNTQVGNEITHLLSIAVDDENEDEPGNLVIKEEEMSSSSGDEDDCDTNKSMIKEEYHCNENENEKKSKQEQLSTPSSPSTSSTSISLEFNNLTKILQNELKFRKLTKLLNEKDNWQKLAQKCQMQQFLCLWSKAEDLLSYIRNRQNVTYETFASALTDIDRDALEVLKTP